MKNEFWSQVLVTKHDAEVLSFGLDEMSAGTIDLLTKKLATILLGVNRTFALTPDETELPLFVTEDEARTLQEAVAWASSHAYHKFGARAGADIVANLEAKLIIAIADITGQQNGEQGE